MLPDQVSLANLVVMILVFAMIMALWLAGIVLWLRQRAWQSRHIGARLEMHDPRLTEKRVLRLWKDGKDYTTAVSSRRRPLFVTIEDACHRAGWNIPASSLVFSLLSASTVLFAAVLIVTGKLFLSLLVVAVVLVCFQLWIKHKIAQRLTLFESQLIEGLELAARSLRAGHPLTASFHLIAEEIRPPVSTVFAEVCQSQAMGVGLEEALRSIAVRSASPDLNLFVTSVIIQTRSGGNLADMMDRLASVIRERRRLAGRVRVLTTQTQLSKRILIAMPIILFLVLNLLNPEYMEPLYNSDAGKTMLAGSAAGLILGAWVMNRLAVLKY